MRSNLARIVQSSQRLALALSVLAVTAGLAVAAGAREASKDRWDLSHIYKSDAGWKKALEALAARKNALDTYKGRLGESPAVLEEALDELHDLWRQAGKLAAYASMRSDEDTGRSGPQGMKQSVQALASELQAAVAWVDPELLSLPKEKLAKFIAQRPGLQEYRRMIEKLDKQRAHVLDAESERILGMAQLVQGDGAFVGNVLRNAEIPWPTIAFSDGTKLRVDAQGYSVGRASNDRERRVKTYKAFYETLRQFQGSLAGTLAATVKEHVFNARVRHYKSSLEAALAPNEVDPAVYRMLVREINASLPSLHRYLKLRGRILGIKDLRYYDMYPPLVSEVRTVYDWKTSKKLAAAALAPLGKEYVSRLLTALEGRWVDVYPRKGKRAGAYVNDSAYGVHPYMLLNHQDDYNSASTLVHESGHLMHSWYSQETQPYATSNYSIFVAEVASTVNEVLLFKNLLAHARDDKERLFLLGNFLEVFRQTVFRQTMFAEFELAIHEATERGQPLTADTLDRIYGDLLRRYHGHDKGIVTIDDLYSVEWSFVPHFHYNFYVYQYATSYVAAVAIAERIHSGQAGAAERHLAFLRSGSSKPPVELLKDNGVDMTSPEPIRAAVRAMNDVMDRIEEILAK